MITEEVVHEDHSPRLVGVLHSHNVELVAGERVAFVAFDDGVVNRAAADKAAELPDQVVVVGFGVGGAGIDDDAAETAGAAAVRGVRAEIGVGGQDYETSQHSRQKPCVVRSKEKTSVRGRRKAKEPE